MTFIPSRPSGARAESAALLRQQQGAALVNQDLGCPDYKPKPPISLPECALQKVSFASARLTFNNSGRASPGHEPADQGVFATSARRARHKGGAAARLPEK